MLLQMALFQAQPVLRNLTASLSGELSVTVDAQIGDTESSKKKKADIFCSISIDFLFNIIKRFSILCT